MVDIVKEASVRLTRKEVIQYVLAGIKKDLASLARPEQLDIPSSPELVNMQEGNGASFVFSWSST